MKKLLAAIVLSLAFITPVKAQPWEPRLSFVEYILGFLPLLFAANDEIVGVVVTGRDGFGVLRPDLVDQGVQYYLPVQDDSGFLNQAIFFTQVNCAGTAYASPILRTAYGARQAIINSGMAYVFDLNTGPMIIQVESFLETGNVCENAQFSQGVDGGLIPFLDLDVELPEPLSFRVLP